MVQAVSAERAGVLLRREANLVLDVWQRNGQLGRGVDPAEEHVGNGVADLLPWHEVGEDGGHVVEPWHQKGPRHAGHDDGLGVRLRDLAHHVVLVGVVACAVELGASEDPGGAVAVQGEVLAIAALAGAGADKDDGEVGAPRQVFRPLHVHAVVKEDLRAGAGGRTDAAEGRDVTRRPHLAGAVAVGQRQGVLGGEADERQPRARRQRQEPTRVLEQDRGLGPEAPCLRDGFGRRDVDKISAGVPR
mmetsp:Transcript_86018/g.244013  ORF Transcript_86018/g.244013 Transcript_86018/m.244013 type:complete len:246 (+) Transcript_86018:448-1185(+)